jgi:hypothetical protein
MAKTRTNTLEDKIRIARDKLVRATRAALMEATPEQALQAWRMVKGQELSRNIPSLTPEQKQSLLQNMAQELGADIINESLKLEQQPEESEMPDYVPLNSLPSATPDPSKQPEDLPDEALENVPAVERRAVAIASPK